MKPIERGCFESGWQCPQLLTLLIRQKIVAEANGELSALMAKFYEHRNSQPGVLVGEKLPPLTEDSESEGSAKSEV